ncbi:U4/U6.U5 tri-snRNP-associated protein 1 isoform X2 [Oratosquilla oratoria]|uniref:U4/U6.U5 tri-snRNP-associated protein 1 isoform X2 n=1 Tax=Oratosquilla oratoria TaxID=337810 RepID=UPI003F7591FD
MGSSKKSKDKDRERNKEEKKKKRRKSRSRSKERDREKHHRHHHKHKRHRKRTREDRSRSASLSGESLSEIEYMQLRDEGLEEEGPEFVPPPPKISKRGPTPPPPKISKSTPVPPPPPIISSGEGASGGGGGSGSEVVGGSGGGGGDISLSLEESNKLRAKLGLKPLQVETTVKDETDEDGVKIEMAPGETLLKDADGEFVHKPAENLADKIKVEKIREKIAAQREKRKIRDKYTKVKPLGDSDSDEDNALHWVNKSRKLQREKAEAEKKAKLLEELDAQFGVGDLVEQELTEQRSKSYGRKNLSGLKVEHDFSRFDDGRTTILTLKDSNVLEEGEDTLVNVNIVDLERVEKNIKNKTNKQDQVEYEAPEVDDYGNIVQKSLLTKYDDEIEGEKKTSFRLGAYGNTQPDRGPGSGQRLSKLRKLQSLDAPEAQLATEYFTPDEMVGFRKVKKTKKKKKKMFTADDLQPMMEGNEAHHGSRKMRMEGRPFEDGTPMPMEDFRATKPRTLKELMEEDEEPVKNEIEEAPHEYTSEEEKDDIDLQEALARQLRAKQNQKNLPTQERVVMMIKEREAGIVEKTEDNLAMTLNTTDEFCRTLGDIPTYGLSGNRAEEDDQTMLQSMSPKQDEPEQRGAWEEVDIDETRVEINDKVTVPILEEEPDASKGVANALKLAMKKGYLEKESNSRPSNAALQHLRAVHYSIEDKTQEDDRGRGRGGDRYSGPSMEFREREGYKPDVKLEYIDDEGRKLNLKEAFRYLSHKFHGKGSGKNKTEKRMKKWHEETLMKHMSSSDTPLQTLERQREKQRQLGTAYLVLSGNKTQESMDIKK